MLDGLAFLPIDEVEEGMKFLKENVPWNCEDPLSTLTLHRLHVWLL